MYKTLSDTFPPAFNASWVAGLGTRGLLAARDARAGPLPPGLRAARSTRAAEALLLHRGRAPGDPDPCNPPPRIIVR